MKTVSTTITCILTALTMLCLESSFADEQKLELDISSVKVEISTNQFSNKEEEELIDQLKLVMKEYFVVSKEDWTHNYEHDASGDSTGTLDWTEDGTKVWQWMIRPGGLASFTDESGITTYLAEVIK